MASTSLKGRFRGCHQVGHLGLTGPASPDGTSSVCIPQLWALSHPMFLPHVPTTPRVSQTPSSYGLSQELLKAEGLLRKRKRASPVSQGGAIAPLSGSRAGSRESEPSWSPGSASPGRKGHGIWEGTFPESWETGVCWTPGVGAHRMTYR